MKISVELRRRPQADEPIEARHDAVMAGLSQIDPPWGLRGRAPVPIRPIGEELQVNVDLGPALGGAVKATLTYVYRSAAYLRDEGQYDDCLFVECDPDTAGYKHLVTEVFPAYVRAFQPYRGTVNQDEDLALEDWDRVVELRKATGEDIEGRDSVFRLGPVSYFDRELCRRAFDLTPEEVVNALDRRIESASMLLDGVLIVASVAPLDRAGLEHVDKSLRNELAARGGRGSSTKLART